MTVARSLIAPTSSTLLERALRDKLGRRSETSGSLGALEPLAVRLGLIQNTLKPRLREPQLVVFAADHGLAVDGIPTPLARSTRDQVSQLLSGRLPAAVFARIQGMTLTVVDAGVADALESHDHLLMRKIAHGTRNSRAGPAMSVERAHAAIRAGMEIGDTLAGNVAACAGIGVGSELSAALVLSTLGDTPLRDLVVTDHQMQASTLGHLLAVGHGAQARHRNVADPVEVLAAVGGFEIAMMVGLMLVSASKRHVLMVDGMAACAALMVAGRIAPAVTDYCVFCRSQRSEGLDVALQLFGGAALIELGLQSTDGTGAALAWPLVRSAAALLTEVADGDDAGPSRPGSSPSLAGTLEGVEAIELVAPVRGTP